MASEHSGAAAAAATDDPEAAQDDQQAQAGGAELFEDRVLSEEEGDGEKDLNRSMATIDTSHRAVAAADQQSKVLTGSPKKKARHSSLELRKVPDHILLTSRGAILDELESQSSAGDTSRRRPSKVKKQGGRPGWFHRTFLNPKYSLRKQMLLTFGTVSALTILVVMIVAIIASILTGNSIKSESQANVEKWVKSSLGTTARYVAETISPRIMPNDLVQIMYEITQDRFAGYPTVEDDSATPFFDIQSQSNVYPLRNPTLPLDWDFRHTPNERIGNVNPTNYQGHVQDRYGWYAQNPRLSTASAFYTMQGACDPRSTDPTALEYYPNCTEANNDLSTGGVVAPSPTNAQVSRKAANLGPFLKALYEYHQDIKELGLYFANGGAGSSVMFPHYEIDSSSSYISVGCDWMRTTNPIDPSLGPIGTEEEIARCHPAGTVVPSREYNPLERGWCRDQALYPDRIQNTGPFADAWNPDNWLMLSGRSVYDRVTGAFVACILIDFTIDGINDIVKEIKIDDWSMLTLARYDDIGTVVTSPNYAADSIARVDDPDLETGVEKAMFNDIKSLVNFTQPWDPEEARRLYETTLFDSKEKIVSAHPIPAIPEEYDPNYNPEFVAILSLTKDEGLAPIVDHVSEEVDDTVRGLVIFTVVLGLCGLAIVILLIFGVASYLTEPLQWMNDVGDQIVGKFGHELDTGIDYERKKALPCSPKTELSSLVAEFTKMVSRFSGEGTAERVKLKEVETKNIFGLSKEFSSLYQSRKEDGFAFDYVPSSSQSVETDASGEQIPERCNFGPNTGTSADTASVYTRNQTDFSGKVYKSPLFWWIVALIVTPLLATAIAISAVVLWNISTDLPSLVKPVKEEYVVLRNATRFTATSMRAIQASGVTERAARDMHVITRYASWLYFGAMDMAESLTELLEGAEECKTAPDGPECTWMKTRPCDCAWNDINARINGLCTEYRQGESRALQRLYFEGQSQDTGPDGSRYSTSFPAVAATPATTAWWDNTTVLPRLSEGFATRYGTTYDRVKIFSALSAVFFPLYNYDTSDDRPIAMYIGFDADGMLAGYNGCDYDPASFAFWVSSESNGAAKLRPELCPLGKYGYDARCRGWYADGKAKADAGAGHLHITSPYLFVGMESPLTAQSATSPLIDQETLEHIGQVLVDFLPNSIFDALETKTELALGGFPILITPESDMLGTDTVVGPKFSLDGDGKAIEELVLPYDVLYCNSKKDCSAWLEFQPILKDMKAGNTGSASFSRTGLGGDTERVGITYAPVYVKSFRALNSSNMASGVERQDMLIYSLGLAETEDGIIQSFQAIDSFVQMEVTICTAVLSVIIVLSAMLVIYIANRVTSSMTKPILELLGLIENINRMNLTDDDLNILTEHRGSCREVDSVYQTMEMLYKVVRFANTAFFAGDLDKAYNVLKDSLKLFTRLGNKKAIAVASNNLGNTMLTIYRTMTVTGEEEMCGLRKKDVVAKGTAYFAHAIKLGEEAYDQFYNEQGWSEECLAFMQFLANRYFNRAMFLLTVKDDHKHPKEAEAMGFRDIQITGDMDMEIVDQCLEMGFKINRVERYDLIMSRIRGILALIKLGYSPDELDIDEHIKNEFRDLKNAMKNPGHELFEDVSPAGRMQKLDVELMKYCTRAKKDKTEAARVAIRMLIEDEYVFPDAQHKAIKTVLIYMNRSDDDERRPQDNDGSIKRELRTYESALEIEFVKRARSRSSLYSLASTSTRECGGSLNTMRSMRGKFSSAGSGECQEEKFKRVSISMRESCRGDFIMESF